MYLSQFLKNTNLFDICNGQDNAIDLIELREFLKKGNDANFLTHCSLFHIDQQTLNCYPPLHFIAGKYNSVEAAKILLEFGADLLQCDTSIKNTPLLTAIAKSDFELASFYVNYIAEHSGLSAVLNQKDVHKDCQNTPLILAFKCRSSEDFLNQLLCAGADVNIAARNGLTPLHYACLFRQHSVIQRLLKRGANPHLRDKFGYTAGEYYVYQIGLLDLESASQIGATSIANFRQLDDLRYHVATADDVFTQSVLIDFFATRNKNPIDVELAKTLAVKEKNSRSLNVIHYKLQMRELPFQRKLRASLPEYLQMHSNVVAIILDEEEWKKNFEATVEFKELQDYQRQQASVKDRVLDSAFAIIDSMQSACPYPDDDYANIAAAPIFKQIKEFGSDEEIDQTISKTTPKIDLLLKSSIFTHVNIIRNIRKKNLYETNKVLDDQIDSARYAAGFLTPEFEAILQEVGYEQYKILKNQIRSLADNIFNTILGLRNRSYQNDMRIGSGELQEIDIRLHRPAMDWKTTKDILQKILQKKIKTEIIASIIAQFNRKDDMDCASYLEFTLADTLSELAKIVDTKLGCILLEEYIRILEGNSRKPADLKFPEISNPSGLSVTELPEIIFPDILRFLEGDELFSLLKVSKSMRVFEFEVKKIIWEHSDASSQGFQIYYLRKFLEQNKSLEELGLPQNWPVKLQKIVENIDSCFELRLVAMMALVQIAGKTYIETRKAEDLTQFKLLLQTMILLREDEDSQYIGQTLVRVKECPYLGMLVACFKRLVTNLKLDSVAKTIHESFFNMFKQSKADMDYNFLKPPYFSKEEQKKISSLAHSISTRTCDNRAYLRSLLYLPYLPFKECIELVQILLATLPRLNKENKELCKKIAIAIRPYLNTQERKKLLQEIPDIFQENHINFPPEYLSQYLPEYLSRFLIDIRYMKNYTVDVCTVVWSHLSETQRQDVIKILVNRECPYEVLIASRLCTKIWPYLKTKSEQAEFLKIIVSNMQLHEGSYTNSYLMAGMLWRHLDDEQRIQIWDATRESYKAVFHSIYDEFLTEYPEECYSEKLKL